MICPSGGDFSSSRQNPFIVPGGIKFCPGVHAGSKRAGNIGPGSFAYLSIQQYSSAAVLLFGNDISGPESCQRAQQGPQRRGGEIGGALSVNTLCQNYRHLFRIPRPCLSCSPSAFRSRPDFRGRLRSAAGCSLLRPFFRGLPHPLAVHGAGPEAAAWSSRSPGPE